MSMSNSPAKNFANLESILFRLRMRRSSAEGALRSLLSEKKRKSFLCSFLYLGLRVWIDQLVDFSHCKPPEVAILRLSFNQGYDVLFEAW